MTRHRWILWCGMLLAWAAGDVGVRHVQAAQPQQRWALLIGIDDYTHAKDLKYCVADQQALKDSLVRSGFDERQVTLLRDKASDAKYLPFKSNIEKQITLLCDLAERGDFVVISFSGHGVHSGKTSYLCPADAKLDDQDSLISLDWIYERLQKSKADLKVVIVDACRNVPPELGSTRSLTGAELKDGSRAFVQATERLPDGLILLNSCSEGEFSQEDEQFGHGVFTHFLLEGLQGKADENKNGKVTLGELTSFASRETKLHVRDRFADSQRPKLKGNLTIEALDFEVSTSRILEKTMTNSIGMKLTLIPAGEFEMGSPGSPDELLRQFPYADRWRVVGEWPVHKVKITKSFYMGTYEVTLGQFLKFYHDAGYKTDSEKDGAGGWGYDSNNKAQPFAKKPKYRSWSWGFERQTNEHPVVNVSWNDAKAFCDWLNRKEGKWYRLPTEAEWEYACRAGTRSRYWPSDDADELAKTDNVADQSTMVLWGQREGTIGLSDGFALSAPVGRFKANPFGLHDMHGNAAEWCEDWYERNYYAKSPLEDPKGPPSGSNRVTRGGSWWNKAVDCRAARRNDLVPSDCSFVVGFRVVAIAE